MGLVNPYYNYMGGDTYADFVDSRQTHLAINNSTVIGYGEAQGASATINTFNGGTSSAIPTVTRGTSTTLNNVAQVNGDAIGSFGYPRVCCLRVALPSITSIRFWFLLMTSGLSVGGTDTPTGNYFGFRFSTSASDSNWMCCSDDNTASRVINSSGIPVGAGTKYLLGMVTTSTSIQYYINRVLVNTITTHLPATSAVNLSWSLQVTTLVGGTAKSVDYGFYRERFHNVGP